MIEYHLRGRRPHNWSLGGSEDHQRAGHGAVVLDKLTVKVSEDAGVGDDGVGGGGVRDGGVNVKVGGGGIRDGGIGDAGVGDGGVRDGGVRGSYIRDGGIGDGGVGDGGVGDGGRVQLLHQALYRAVAVLLLLPHGAQLPQHSLSFLHLPILLPQLSHLSLEFLVRLVYFHTGFFSHFLDFLYQ